MPRWAQRATLAAGAMALAGAGLVACSDGNGGGGGDGLRLVARDFRFEPATFEVVGGSQATVEVTNAGSTTHNVTIAESGVDLDLRPGETVNLIFVPSGDRLSFSCKYHADRMTGNIVVR